MRLNILCCVRDSSMEIISATDFNFFIRNLTIEGVGDLSEATVMIYYINTRKHFCATTYTCRNPTMAGFKHCITILKSAKRKESSGLEPGMENIFQFHHYERAE